MRGFKLNTDAALRHPKATHALEAFSDAYAEVVDVGLLSVHADGTLLAYNTRFAQLCALPQRGLAGGTLAELVDWLCQQQDELSLALSSLLAGGAGTQGELTSSDGRALEWKRVPVASGQGHVWAISDVTAARQLGAALMDAAGWLRMLELHTDGVLLELDVDARIVGLWGPGRQFFEPPDAVLQGKTLAEVIAGPEGAALDARVRQVLSSASREDYECCIDVGGEQRVVSTSAVLMQATDETPPHVTLMMRDVTERARMQTKLLQVEQLASVGLLAAGVAHEINNPLAYVLLNLERLRSNIELFRRGQHDSLLAEISTAVSMSIEGASRVQGIVRDLKHFSHPDEGRRLPVDIHHSLDFAIAMAEPELQGRAKLTRHYGILPMVRASEARLSQIFLNLIINAAHALSDVRGRGEIRITTRTGPSGRAIIEVQDNGPGIDSAALRRVFEPFYTTKPAGLGIGLGLMICHDIVKSLDGEIEVDSVEGQGSVFRVALPPAVVESEPEVTTARVQQ